MKLFESHQVAWEGILEGDVSLRELLDKKLVPLFSDTSKESGKQGLETLCSIDPRGLCHIVDFDGKGFALAGSYGFGNIQSVEHGIVEEVSKEESVWYPLYEEGFFDGMVFRCMGEVDFGTLDQGLQKKILKESKRMVEIPKGSFTMGALERDDEANDFEKPRHKVELTQDMLMCRYLVTQALWESVMGNNPSYFKGATRPVDEVSWCDAVLFCNKLSLFDGLEPVYELPEPFQNDDDWSKRVSLKEGANGYRLPTEAQWEYCARGGEEHLYAGSDDLDEVGWFDVNSNEETHPVGQKKPNCFGLYDMSGNVWEWVWDSWYDYSSDSVVDPVHLDRSSPGRVFRGGSWNNDSRYCRVSFRDWIDASLRDDFLGFRFLRTLK